MAFLLLILISATWLLGLMAVNSDVMTFHYLFAVFSCLQVIANLRLNSGCTDKPHTLVSVEPFSYSAAATVILL